MNVKDKFIENCMNSFNEFLPRNFKDMIFTLLIIGSSFIFH